MRPKPAAETASSSLLCDTGATQTPVERFVFEINAGHSLAINHEGLLDKHFGPGLSCSVSVSVETETRGPRDRFEFRLPKGKDCGEF